jgi:predicted dinucleotide-binding enzyme
VAAWSLGALVAVPIAGDEPHAIDIAAGLIRQIGFDPVVIGGLAMGKYPQAQSLAVPMDLHALRARRATRFSHLWHRHARARHTLHKYCPL